MKFCDGAKVLRRMKEEGGRESSGQKTRREGLSRRSGKKDAVM
jgi:hypothetical protein